MSVTVFDTAALIALDRNDAQMWWQLGLFAELEYDVLVPSTVVAQCWRGLARQANLSRALAHCSIVPFDPVAREVGILCGRAKTSDIVDAHVALIASTYEAESLYTGEPDDLSMLLEKCGGRATLIHC